MKIFTISFLTGCLILHGVMNYENEDYAHFRTGDCIEHYQVQKYDEIAALNDDGDMIYKSHEVKTGHRKVACPSEVSE